MLQWVDHCISRQPRSTYSHCLPRAASVSSSAFGVNTWTGRDAGDRIINEHDEAEENEELYVVLQGRAVFELDAERVDAPAGTLVFAHPGVKRIAFAEEPETTIIALGGTPVGFARTQRTIRTSIRSAMSQRSRN